MSKLASVSLALVTGAALLAAPAVSQVGGRPLTANLTGAAEVPGPGDTNGGGSARITVNPGRGEICYKISVRDIAPATAAHIHRGGATAAGPVVRGLTAPTSGSSEGCAEVTRELALDILKNPANFYVNVHNDDFRAGAVRGQLGK